MATTTAISNKAYVSTQPGAETGTVSDLALKYIGAFTDDDDNDYTAESTENEVDNSNWKSMPDLLMLLYPVGRDRDSVLDSGADEHMTISANGMAAFTDDVDGDVTVELGSVRYGVELTISDLASLKALEVSSPFGNPSQPAFVEVYDDSAALVSRQSIYPGASFIMDRARFPDPLSSLTVKVWFFDGPAYALDAQVESMSVGSPSKPIMVHLDFLNVFEGGAGLLGGLLVGGTIGVTSGAASGLIRNIIGEDESIQSSLAQVGMSVAEAVAIYTAVLGMASDQGWVAWTDWDINQLLAPLKNISGLLAMGTLGVQMMLNNMGLSSRATYLTNMATSGARGLVLSMAYLGIVSVISRHIYGA